MKRPSKTDHSGEERSKPDPAVSNEKASLQLILSIGPLGELSQRILLTGASTTYTVKKLEQRGLLMRRAKHEDQRVILRSITEQGRKLMQRMFPLHASDVAHAMRALSFEEKKTAIALLRQLQSLAIQDET